MKKEFVTYEIALKLKELGFDEEVIATFDNNEEHELKIFAFLVPNKGIFEKGFQEGWCIKAPLWQQVIDWFREEHNLYISVLPFKLNDEYDIVKLCWYYFVVDINRDSNITLDADSLNPSIENFNSLEQAREQAILKAINDKRLKLK